MERKFGIFPETFSPQFSPNSSCIPPCLSIPEDQLESQIDLFLNYTHDNHIFDFTLNPRKRGRKPIRPLNPTKTEIMDKFWLRGFREFMRMNQIELKSSLDDKKFWEFFLSRGGNPGKKRKFLSYSKNYKEFLFSNQSFSRNFVAWVLMYGCIKLPRKNFRGNWDLYFNYLCTDLVQPCKVLVRKDEVVETLKNFALVYEKYCKAITDYVAGVDWSFN